MIASTVVLHGKTVIIGVRVKYNNDGHLPLKAVRQISGGRERHPQPQLVSENYMFRLPHSEDR